MTLSLLVTPMMTCTVCGQPIPQARSNQLTCSPKCRTRRYRQNQPRSLNGSGPLRRGLLLARPNRFFLRLPDKTYQGATAIGVPPEQWDQTLEVLNTVYSLLEPIEIILNWQGETGYSPPSDEPVVDFYLANLSDVVGSVLQELANLREKLAALQGLRSPASRPLGQHLGELNRLLTEVIGHGRRFARQAMAEAKPYQVAYSADFVTGLAALRTAIETSWFALYD